MSDDFHAQHSTLREAVLYRPKIGSINFGGPRLPVMIGDARTGFAYKLFAG